MGYMLNIQSGHQEAANFLSIRVIAHICTHIAIPELFQEEQHVGA